MIVMRKAIEKDLDYWKKKLIGILNKAPMSKSIEDIFVPGGMLKSLDSKAKRLLDEVILKARGYAVGTIREWSGKKYKKISSGKWMRTYSGTEERGEQQAIRNVMRKLQNASSMSELSSIVSANMQRFKDDSGKTLPIVKEFMSAARGTESGKKEKKPEIKKEEKPKESPEEMRFKRVLTAKLEKVPGYDKQKAKDTVESYGDQTIRNMVDMGMSPDEVIKDIKAERGAMAHEASDKPSSPTNEVKDINKDTVKKVTAKIDNQINSYDVEKVVKKYRDIKKQADKDGIDVWNIEDILDSADTAIAQLNKKNMQKSQKIIIRSKR